MIKEQIRKLAKKQIIRCKKRCYDNYNCPNSTSEGDFGSWKDWENVLVRFAEKIIIEHQKQQQ